MKTLEIDTSKTFYKPIELKIDGEIFKVKRISFGALEEIQKFQEDAFKGSASAIRKMLDAILEGPLEKLGKLSVDQVGQVIEFAIQETTNPDEEQKNAPGPGPNQ